MRRKIPKKGPPPSGENKGGGISAGGRALFNLRKVTAILVPQENVPKKNLNNLVIKGITNRRISTDIFRCALLCIYFESGKEDYG